MKKQVVISFSSTYAELTVFHSLLSFAKEEKHQTRILLQPLEKSNKFVDRLKKRFA